MRNFSLQTVDILTIEVECTITEAARCILALFRIKHSWNNEEKPSQMIEFSMKYIKSHSG
jgi:hypothetical protein